MGFNHAEKCTVTGVCLYTRTSYIILRANVHNLMLSDAPAVIGRIVTPLCSHMIGKNRSPFLKMSSPQYHATPPAGAQPEHKTSKI